MLIERFLWERATTQLEQLEQQQSQALCIWDGSVLEKAESEKVEGLCAVRGSLAKRLRKLKPGLFNQLSGPPIVVRGMEWTGVLLAGLKHAPSVVAMKWWSRKGQHATTRAPSGTGTARAPGRCMGRAGLAWGRIVAMQVAIG